MGLMAACMAHVPHAPVPWQYSQRRRPLPSQQSHGSGLGFCEWTAIASHMA